MKTIIISLKQAMWILALLACFAFPSMVQGYHYTNINGVVWTWTYEGDVNPGSAIPPFAVGVSVGTVPDAPGSVASDGTNMTIISGHTSSAYVIMPGGGGLLGNTNWDGATTSGSTIEVRMRILEDTSQFSGPVGLFIETGPLIYELKFHTDRVDFDGFEYFLDATQFHTYRITVDPAGPGQIAFLYIDGGTNAVIRDNNRHGDDVNRLMIGDPSGGNYGGKTEWDYVRWTNAGQYPPLTPVGPLITITPNGGTLRLLWSGGGALQSSTNVAGPYADIIPATISPYDVAPTGGQNFYRVRQ